MKQLITVGCFLTLYAHVFGQNTFNVSLNREDILIGEQANLEIKIKAGSGDTIIFPQIGDTIISEIEVINKQAIDTTYEGKNLEYKVLSQKITITSFDSGYYAIKPLTARLNGDTIESNPFLIAVNTIKTDTIGSLADIKDIEQIPFPLAEWMMKNWHWFAISLASALIILILIFYFKNRPVTEKPKVLAPAIPPHEIALERLSELEAKKLWQNGKTKAYYSELTEILREYIEAAFEIPALEQTTEEIISAMNRKPDFNADTIVKIKRLLFMADLVKFAKENPTGTENQQYFELVGQFVMETKPALSEIEKKPTHG